MQATSLKRVCFMPSIIFCIYIYVCVVCLWLCWRKCTLPILIKFTYVFSKHTYIQSNNNQQPTNIVTTKGSHHTVSAKTASIWTSHFGKRTSLYHTRQLCCTRTRGKLTAYRCMHVLHTYSTYTYIYCILTYIKGNLQITLTFIHTHIHAYTYMLLKT